MRTSPGLGAVVALLVALVLDARGDDREGSAGQATTTIGGLQAVRLEHETGGGSWAEGTPVTAYAVDLSPGVDDGSGTLLLDTVGLEPFDYQRNRVVLDRAAGDVPSAPGVVARYEGGGGGFRVEGTAGASEACLRIPPGGDPAGTGIPDADGVRTVELVDLDPVLAGVAGDEVFRVTAERRRAGASPALPAPVGATGARGFAFTFGPDEVDRLRFFDVTGAERGTLEPGGGSAASVSPPAIGRPT